MALLRVHREALLNPLALIGEEGGRVALSPPSGERLLRGLPSLGAPLGGFDGRPKRRVQLDDNRLPPKATIVLLEPFGDAFLRRGSLLEWEGLSAPLRELEEVLHFAPV